ncbi:hypothetical protein ERJ75_000636900 [Trypanosoma vivax]|nr:hypothetical protein ERJ75_000636900 [Trypanosoma vivax]
MDWQEQRHRQTRHSSKATESMRLRLGTGQGTAAEGKDLAETAATVVADLAKRAQWQNSGAKHRAEHSRRHLPLVLRTHNGLRHLAGRSQHAVRSPGRTVGTQRNRDRPQDIARGKSGQRHHEGAGHRRASQQQRRSAPSHREAHRGTKGREGALAGRQGVDAKVAECHRLLDTNTTNEGTPSATGKNVEAWLAWISTSAGPWTNAKVTPTSPRQQAAAHKVQRKATRKIAQKKNRKGHTRKQGNTKRRNAQRRQHTQQDTTASHAHSDRSGSTLGGTKGVKFEAHKMRHSACLQAALRNDEAVSAERSTSSKDRKQRTTTSAKKKEQKPKTDKTSQNLHRHKEEK